MKTFINWIQKNKAAAGGTFLAIILALALGGVFFKQMRAAKQQSWEMLSAAQSLAMAGRGSDALQVLNEAASRYSGSRVGDFALVQKANLLMRGRMYNEALQAYQDVLMRQKVQELIPLARIGAAKAYEASGALDKAAQEYESFLASYQDHFSAPEAFEGLARVSEASGNKEKAKENLERLKALYPDTTWARHAETKLKTLLNSR